MLYILLMATGIVSVSLLPILPSLLILFPLLFIAIYCYWQQYFHGLSLLAGFVIGLFQAHIVISSLLPLELEGTPLQVVGVVSSIPVIESKKIRFIFSIEQALSPKNIIKTPLKVQLNYYLNNKYHSSKLKVIPGQRWLFTIKLRRSRGFVNPAGFDYQAYLMSKKIAATGYIVNSKPIKKVVEYSGNHTVNYWRWKLLKKLQTLSGNSTVFPYIAGLLVGERQWLSGEQWVWLKNTGTIHLLAISGLHIGLAGSIGFALGKIISQIFLLFSRGFTMIQRYTAIFFSLFFASFYSLLAGMTLPTQRALIMLICFHVMLLLYRRPIPWLLLSAAFLGVVLIDPFAIYSQSLWLSFGAVFILCYGFYGRTNLQGKHYFLAAFLSLSKAQYLLLFGLVVVYGYWFHTVNLVAPIANMLAVPLISLLVVPLLFVLLALIFIGDFFDVEFIGFLIDKTFLMAEYNLITFEKILQFFSGFSEDLILFFPRNTSYFLLLITFSSFLLWLSPRGIASRYLVIVIFGVLFFYKEEEFNLRLTILDSGQATAVLVETKSHTMVYDTGRRFSSRFNTGEHIIAPYLYALGKNSIDKLMVSHSDGDHAGGMAGLLKNINVKEISGGQPEASMLSVQQPMQQCKANQEWQWDTVNFRVLWPNESFLNNPNELKKDNNYSCVLLISIGGRHILLAGDIEAPIEKYLLHEGFLPNEVDVILVPHHGSRTSSSEQWVKELNPRWALLTTGYKNSYGHPHPTVIDRYRKINSQIINTATDGATRLTLNLNELSGVNGINKEWQVEQWRRDYQRYWYNY